MEEKPPAVNLDLNFLYKEGYSGVLVGQCVEIPGVIVEAKTYEGLKEELGKAVEGYLKAFPEERAKIFKKFGKTVDTKEWNKIQVVCTIR